MFVVVSVPTNGSSVACNVVIWVSLIQPWTKNRTQQGVKLIYDMTSDCLQLFTLSSDWNLKEKTQQSFVVQEVV